MRTKPRIVTNLTKSTDAPTLESSGVVGELSDVEALRTLSDNKTVVPSSFLGHKFHAFRLTSQIFRGKTSTEFLLWSVGVLLAIPLVFLLVIALCHVLASRGGGGRQRSGNNNKGNFVSEFPPPGTQPVVKDDSSSEGEEDHDDMMAEMLEDVANHVRRPGQKKPRHGVSAYMIGAQDKYIAVRPASGVDTTGRQLTKLEQWTEASLSWWNNMEGYLRDDNPNGSIPVTDVILVYQNANDNPLEVVIEYQVMAEGTKTPGGRKKGLRFVESMELIFSREVDAKDFVDSVTRYTDILRKRGVAIGNPTINAVTKYRTT